MNVSLVFKEQHQTHIHDPGRCQPPAAATSSGTNCAASIVLADEAARADLAARHPEARARVGRRRGFMADRLGIRLRPEVLPLSNLAGYLPRYWLAPGLAMRKG
jgi:hypothetical protein